MNRLQRSIVDHLHRLQEAGVSDLPRPDSAQVAAWIQTINGLAVPETDNSISADTASLAAQDSQPASVQSARQTVLPESTTQHYPPALAADERGKALHVIQSEVCQCTRCPELVRQRQQTVFGVGNPAADICFLGEAPGADEDRMGEPFVGKAGQLLTRIIEACQLGRDDVYILNTIKCRPPGNRNPAEDEISNCWHFAHRQLEIIRPKVIVCLGSVAARTLLDTKQSVGRLRQQFHQYRESAVAVTYHPAYLLRNPSAKRNVWDDMKMVMRHLGVEL